MSRGTVAIAIVFAMLARGTPTMAQLRTVETTELGVRATQFTINGQPSFFLGIRDYGALGAPEDFIRLLGEPSTNDEPSIRQFDRRCHGNLP